MDTFQERELRHLLEKHPGPNISLYIPTHRGGSQMDVIRFRNAVHQAQEKLIATGMKAAEARRLLDAIELLRRDEEFWKHTSDGLAVFGNKDFLNAYRLPWPFEERLEVGDLFLITPLLASLHEDRRYFVLALSQNQVRLLEGTRHSVREIKVEGLPPNIKEAMQNHDRDKALTLHTRPKPGIGWGAIFEGHGTGIDDAKDELSLFFRQIDQALHSVLRGESAPLLLAAVGYLHPLYREKNTYAHLSDLGIVGNPKQWSDDEIRDRAWNLVEPDIRQSVNAKVAEFHAHPSSGKAISNTFEILHCATKGNIETLFVNRDRSIRGCPPAPGGEWILHESPQQGDEDLANDAAVQTLRHRHTVEVLSEDQMPEKAALAAILFAPVSYQMG
ncbi:hypothetical protein VN12_19235 [Pirellula sp. SH-Sr6A]|uniref:baeRF3 domain-containing protein n=1 Tax=Pirellula sp. SH-Sr6A TaxID=1632865 RepID=UPI00078DBB15|nr:hypothetical protein [Pirellula sp. SH-Sr6A]AMV34268.1 hypothetical protein VN12_19235 [Pirellula sp. SH-Sr6A]